MMLYCSIIELYNCSTIEHIYFMQDNQDHFNVLRKINDKSQATQRELAEQLGFSLGKLNYCLKALKNKGLIKMKNFGKNPNKINYIYLLTSKKILEEPSMNLL